LKYDSSGLLVSEFDLPSSTTVYGSNGSPIQSVDIQYSHRIYEIQAVNITASSLTSNAQFRLSLNAEPTICLGHSVTATELKLALESLAVIDGVEVSGENGQFIITFIGSELHNGNVDELLAVDVANGQCQGPVGDISVNVKTLVDGKAGFIPQIYEIETSSSSQISGTLQFSFGFTGSMTQLLPGTVSVESRSRLVYTSNDWTTKINRGDYVLIANELHRIAVVVDSTKVLLARVHNLVLHRLVHMRWTQLLVMS